MDTIKPRTKGINIEWLVQQIEIGNTNIKDITANDLSTSFTYPTYDEPTPPVIDATSIQHIMRSILHFALTSNKTTTYNKQQQQRILLHRLFAGLIALSKIQHISSATHLSALCRFLKLDYHYLRRQIIAYKRHVYDKQSK